MSSLKSAIGELVAIAKRVEARVRSGTRERAKRVFDLLLPRRWPRDDSGLATDDRRVEMVRAARQFHLEEGGGAK
jgi:hypothetical protein